MTQPLTHRAGEYWAAQHPKFENTEFLFLIVGHQTFRRVKVAVGVQCSYKNRKPWVDQDRGIAVARVFLNRNGEGVDDSFDLIRRVAP